jgi:hypothetical protein
MCCFLNESVVLTGNAKCIVFMDIQPFYGKVPYPLLLVGLQSTRGKISGISNCLNYSVILIVYT